MDIYYFIVGAGAGFFSITLFNLFLDGRLSKSEWITYRIAREYVSELDDWDGTGASKELKSVHKKYLKRQRTALRRALNCIRDRMLAEYWNDREDNYGLTHYIKTLPEVEVVSRYLTELGIPHVIKHVEQEASYTLFNDYAAILRIHSGTKEELDDWGLN